MEVLSNNKNKNANLRIWTTMIQHVSSITLCQFQTEIHSNNVLFVLLFVFWNIHSLIPSKHMVFGLFFWSVVFQNNVHTFSLLLDGVQETVQPASQPGSWPTSFSKGIKPLKTLNAIVNTTIL